VSIGSAVGKPSVAVVGAGVSGLTAAYLLQRTHDVTLFEGQQRLGGHAHTHDVPGRHGSTVGVDSGFIVHNDRTYPLLRRLFAELQVEVAPTEMSMSVRCEGCGLEYAGGRGARAVFAQPRRATSPQFLSMLLQVGRFNRRAKRYLATASPDDLTTLGRFLARGGFDTYFVRHYALAFVSCVWSTGHADALRYPARYLFAFLDHHGLLDVTSRDSCRRSSTRGDPQARWRRGARRR
jgi:predicted NAD/FAD-binding protein